MMRGYRRLAAKVLHQALLDVRSHPEARQWLLGQREGLEWWCLLAGVTVEDVRLAVERRMRPVTDTEIVTPKLTPKRLDADGQRRGCLDKQPHFH
jgi:hypothetical protein